MTIRIHQQCAWTSGHYRSLQVETVELPLMWVGDQGVEEHHTDARGSSCPHPCRCSGDSSLLWWTPLCLLSSSHLPLLLFMHCLNLSHYHMICDGWFMSLHFWGLSVPSSEGHTICYRLHFISLFPHSGLNQSLWFLHILPIRTLTVYGVHTMHASGPHCPWVWLRASSEWCVSSELYWSLSDIAMVNYIHNH